MESTRMGHMSGCQNDGPFGYPKYEVPYYNRDPKKDHNFDNHPFGVVESQGLQML